jgi:hypothetical protein
MVCTTDAGVTHCEAPLRHYRVSGTRDFFDDGLVHQFDLLGVGCRQRSQGRKDAHQHGHRCAIALGGLARRELNVVREQHPVSAHLIFQRQGLRLELDPVVAGDVRTHVQFRGLLHIRVAELEHDFRVARGEAVYVSDAPAQDESMVVESEVSGVEEEDTSMSNYAGAGTKA